MRLKKCIWIPSIIAIHHEPFSKEEVNGYGIYFVLDCYISIALYFMTVSMGCDAPNWYYISKIYVVWECVESYVGHILGWYEFYKQLQEIWIVTKFAFLGYNVNVTSNL